MVAGIILVVGLVGLAFVFKDQIGSFLSGGLTDLGKGFNEALAGAGKSIDETAKDIDTSIKKTFVDPVKVFQFNQEANRLKTQQATEMGFSSVKELEIKTDPNRTSNLGLDDLGKFNPPNTVGFGILGINQGRGIMDTPENRKLVLDFATKETNKELNVQTEKTLTALAQESKNVQAVTKPQPNRGFDRDRKNVFFDKRFGGQQKTKAVTQEVRNPVLPAPKPEIILNQSGTGTTTDPFRGSQPDKTLVSPFLLRRIES